MMRISLTGNFRFARGVKFHDGTIIEYVTRWRRRCRRKIRRDGHASAAGAAVAFEFKSPRPNLLVELATGRSFIFRAAQDTVVGTGPFRITDWQAQKRLELKANDDDWAGRPFVDRIEIALGVSSQQQLVDLELGKVDVIELLPNLTRRASQVSERAFRLRRLRNCGRW